MDIAQLGYSVDTQGIKKGIDALKDMDKAGDKIGGTAKKSGGAVNRSMRSAGMEIDKTKNKTKNLGMGLGALKGIVAGIGFATAARETSKYISSLAEVSTLVDTSTFDMQALSDAALEQSKRFGTMPTDNVEAFYQAISAGATSVEQANEAMEVANTLAIAGVTDTKTAVDGLTSVMNAYNGEAGSFADISDTMFAAVKAGKTTIPEFSSAIGSLAPIAAQAGGSFDEMAAAVATLTAGGVSTSTAMNGLRGVMAAVVKPSGPAIQAAKDLGIEFNASSLKAKGFAGFLEHVRQQTGGNTEALGQLFGGVEALTPIMALATTQNEKFSETMKAVADKTGLTEEALQKMMATPAFQKNRIVAGLTAEFLELTTGLGNGLVPILIKVADGIGPFFDKIHAGIDTVKQFGTQFKNAFENIKQSAFDENVYGKIDKGNQAMQVFAGIVRIIWEVVKPLTPYLNEFFIALIAIKSAAVAASAISGVGAAIGGIGRSIGLLNPVVLGVTALATAAYLIYQNWDGIVAWWSNTWASLKSTASSFMNWWRNTPLDQKALDITTTALDTAESTATMFFGWWNNSTLKEISPPIVTNAIATAETKITEFFSVWNTLNLEEKQVYIKALAVEKAKEIVSGFKTFWDKPLAEKTAIIKTTYIDLFKTALSILEKSWAVALVKKLTPTIVSDSIVKAYDYVKDLFDKWNNATLNEIAFKIGYEVVQTAIDIIEKLKKTYKDVYDFFKNIDLFAPIKDAISLFKKKDVSGDMKQLGADVGNGLIDGIKSKTESVKGFFKSMLQGGVQAAKDTVESRSPSKVFKRLGLDIAEGLRLGITDNMGKPIDAMAGMSSKVIEEFVGIVRAVDDKIAKLKLSGEELRKYELAQKGVKDEAAALVIEKENLADALELVNKQAENSARYAKELATEQRLQNIELTEGAAAAREAELKLQGLNPEIIATGVATEQAMESQKKFHTAIYESVSNASSVKEVFQNLGDYLKQWLKDKIALFAANKITAYVTGNTEGFGSILSSVSGLLGGGGGGAGIGGLLGGGGAGGGILSTLTSGVGSLFGSGSGIAGALSGATSSIAALGASALTMAGPLAAAAGGLALSAGAAYAFADAVGGNAKGAAIGTAVGGIALGPLGLLAGGLIGGALGGDWETTERGFDVGYQGGDVVGQNFHREEKQKSFFRGTDRRTTYGELDSGVDAQLSEYFSNLNATIVSHAGLLGDGAADAILDNFTVATERFSGGNIEEDLAAWLETSTVDAYSAAFDKLGPNVQELIGRQVDMVEGSVQEIEAAFANVGQFAATFVPALESVGLAFESVDSAIGVADNLVTAFGSAETAMQRLALYRDEFVPDAVKVEQAAQALKKQKTELAAFNFSILSTGNLAISSREGLYKYIEGLEAQHAAGLLTDEQLANQTATALQHMDAIIAVDNEQQRVIASTAAVTDAARLLNLQFDASAPMAGKFADSLVQLMGGMEGFNQATGNYYNTFFSEEERKNIALTDAAAQVRNFNNSLGLAGDAAIDTRKEFRAYVEGLDLQTEAGQRAYAEAMNMVDAMGAVVESEKTVSEIMAGMPENLQDNFAMMTAETEAANAQILALHSQREEQMIAAESRYTEQNQKAIESLAQYADGLDQSTFAGESAYKATMSQIDMLRELETVSGDNSTAIDAAVSSLESYKQTLDTGTTSGMLAAQATDEQIRALDALKETTWVANDAFTNQKIALDAAAVAADTLAQRQSAATDFTNASTQDMWTNWYQSVNNISTANDAVVADTTNAANATREITMSMNKNMVNEFSNTKNAVNGELRELATQAGLSAADAVGKWQTGAIGISNAASSANGSLNNTAGAIGNVGKAAITAANDAATASQRFYERTRTSAAAWSNWYRSSNPQDFVDGTHKTGAYSIPFDGYIAEVHKDEMINTAGVSNKLRAMGVTENSIPSNFGERQQTMVIAPVPVSRGGDNGMVESKLAAIESELKNIRSDNNANTSRTINAVGGVTSATVQNARILKEQNKITEREAIRRGNS